MSLLLLFGGAGTAPAGGSDSASIWQLMENDDNEWEEVRPGIWRRRTRMPGFDAEQDEEDILLLSLLN